MSESAVRARARTRGYHIRKSQGSMHFDNYGKYTLIDSYPNAVVLRRCRGGAGLVRRYHGPGVVCGGTRDSWVPAPKRGGTEAAKEFTEGQETESEAADP